MAQRITTDTFRTIIAGESRAADDCIVVRAGPSAVQEVGGNRRLLWCISSEAVDRMGDIIRVAGWDLRNFEAGGSILWAHDPTVLPVARPVKTYAQGNKLWSVAEYPEADVSAFADTVYKLAKGGFLRGASIGMRPVEYAIDETRRSVEHQCPITFTKQELLEWSHTPVPANPEALLAAKSCGIDVSPLRQWCERALDENLEVTGVTREALESSYRITGKASSMVAVADTVVAKAEMDAEDPALNPAANPESLRAEKCNAMLRELLAASEMMLASADDEMLDLELASQCRVLFDTIAGVAAVEAAEEVDTNGAPAEVEPTGAMSDTVPGKGVDNYESKCHEELNESDIRAIVRDLTSKYIKERKIRLPGGRR